MTTARAKYVGDGAGKKTRAFSESLKQNLRIFYPQQNAVDCPVFGHPADAFANEVLAQAHRSVSELMFHELDLTKAEILAEYTDLLNLLTKANRKLRSLSVDLSKLFEIDTDPLEVADKISRLIDHVKRAEPTINGLPTKPKTSEIQHEVAVEMAINVLRVANKYGIKVVATYDANFGYTSDAVKILKAIGDDIGFRFSEVTWKNIVIQAKKNAIDIR
ncbi:hypothetical protein [Paraburkholderia domus]|uniref:hypothetical protein n=1 Tax=Paraburkholderia domus TaxID=2793075 RepID=UPI001B00EEE0|nr:hypothetical protein [Paraburkholderia domus]CAE6747646.1 hypothetical protein R75483_02971 [Paraburkholderia domus]